MPSDKTLIARPLSEDELGKKECEEIRSKALEVLEKVKKHLGNMTDDELENSDLDKILKNLSIDSHVYHDALARSTRGNVVVLKRYHSYIT